MLHMHFTLTVDSNTLDTMQLAGKIRHSRRCTNTALLTHRRVSYICITKARITPVKQTQDCVRHSQEQFSQQSAPSTHHTDV